MLHIYSQERERIKIKLDHARLQVTVRPHLRNKWTDLVLYLHQTTQTTLHNGREVEQPQCVTSGSGVEDNHREVHSFD